MKLSISRAVVGFAALSFGLTGCGSDQYPSYSAGIKYGLRQDPVIRGPVKDLGEERYDPDRPGILPLMKISDILNPDHPYHAKMKDIDEKILRDPTKIPEQYRKELQEALEATFGTPAKPSVSATELGIDAKIIDDLKLDDATLARGSTYYRVHCLHCHGVPGDGRGPTARWINPHPRDFRAGLFKFQSVDQTDRAKPPSRADLMRTLRQGIEGTAMPSFNLLKDEELEALVSYVIHLSIRGNVERETIKVAFVEENGALAWNKEEGPMKENVKTYGAIFAGNWRDSNSPSAAIPIAKYPYDANDMEALKASVKRGQEIFTAKPSPELKEHLRKHLEKETGKPVDDAALEAKANTVLKGANCVSCHTDYGRQARYRFDEWGTLVRPNDLPLGFLRGGKRPVDIYFRVHSGINGSGMTPFGNTFKGHEAYIWDLINFVQSVSFPAMRDRLDIRLD